MPELLLDRAGRRRSPATLPGFHAGNAPSDKGLRYPADPPKIDEIIAVTRAAGDRAHGRRPRRLIATLWRSGLRIQEVIALTERDLDQHRGSLVVRPGKGGRRREVGTDTWGWEQLQPWLDLRRELPVEMAREGVPRIVIQRQVGQSNLGITSVYLQGIDSGENHRDRPRPTRAHDPRQRVAPAPN
jgi:integrase